MSKHIMRNGKLIKIHKKFSDLSTRQQEFIREILKNLHLQYNNIGLKRGKVTETVLLSAQNAHGLKREEGRNQSDLYRILQAARLRSHRNALQMKQRSSASYQQDILSLCNHPVMLYQLRSHLYPGDTDTLYPPSLHHCR